MDAHRARVAATVEAVARELQQLGMWGAAPPTPAAMASTLPFCADTLSLPEWLQWVFVPRMRALLDADAELPAASAIRPMAEESLAAEGPRVMRLLRLLGECDALLSQPRQ